MLYSASNINASPSLRRSFVRNVAFLSWRINVWRFMRVLDAAWCGWDETTRGHAALLLFVTPRGAWLKR